MKENDTEKFDVEYVWRKLLKVIRYLGDDFGMDVARKIVSDDYSKNGDANFTQLQEWSKSAQPIQMLTTYICAVQSVIEARRINPPTRPSHQ
jgi:hypothetical protein